MIDIAVYLSLSVESLRRSAILSEYFCVSKLDNWTTIKDKITGKEKVDNRTDEEIEKETIELYNKYFLKEG